MRRFLGLSIILVAAALALMACGGGSTNGGTKSGQGPSGGLWVVPTEEPRPTPTPFPPYKAPYVLMDERPGVQAYLYRDEVPVEGGVIGDCLKELDAVVGSGTRIKVTELSSDGTATILILPGSTSGGGKSFQLKYAYQFVDFELDSALWMPAEGEESTHYSVHLPVEVGLKGVIDSARCFAPYPGGPYISGGVSGDSPGTLAVSLSLYDYCTELQDHPASSGRTIRDEMLGLGVLDPCDLSSYTSSTR